MKITFVLPHAGMAGGIRVLAIYAEILQRRGHSVAVFSLPKRKKSFRARLRYLLTGRWAEFADRSASSHFDSCTVPHYVLDRIRPVVDADLPDADVVVATFWATGPWVAGLSGSKGEKAIFLQGYETSPGQERPEIDAVWRLPLRKIVISSWMSELARERFGDHNALLVPNGVDCRQFDVPRRGRRAIPTVGFLYSTLHLKGVDVTVKAIDLVRQRFKDLRVVVFGAERVSPDLQLPGNAEFHLLPAQSHIPNLYASCDVWLCGSRREGFHLPPLEAMACRCPVVSTKVGGPLDTIVDGENGYLVDVDDTESLGRRVIDVLSLSDSEWQTMSDAARATAVLRNWEDAATRFEDALRQIVEDGAAGRISATARR